MNCWERFDCNVKEVCPAYPDQGTGCAKVAGTLCQGREKVIMAQKIDGCKTCDHYKSDDYDHSFQGFFRLEPSQNIEMDDVKETAKHIAEIDTHIDTFAVRINTLLDIYQEELIDMYQGELVDDENSCKKNIGKFGPFF